MAPDSLDPPRTPSRAASSEPCLVRRDSMEDADSSVTRKRPRLDSGERAYRSMSADKAVGAIGSSEHEGSTSLPPHSRSEQPELLRTPSPTLKQLPSLNRTPSRVTINVRTPVGVSSTANSATGPEPDSAGPNAAMRAVDSDNNVDRPATSGRDSSRAISISSSPPRSPEIEVAEVEDMDQDPSETKWTSVVNIMGTLETLLDTFPLSDRYPSLRDTVAYIAQIFEKGSRAFQADQCRNEKANSGRRYERWPTTRCACGVV